MKKMRLDDLKNITFEEGCNKYLDDCRARNLREGTIQEQNQSACAPIGLLSSSFCIFLYFTGAIPRDFLKQRLK